MLQIKINDAEIKFLGIQLKQLKNIVTKKKVLAPIGQVLASQGKINLQEGTPDGKNSYALLNPKTIKQKVKTSTPSRGKNKGITRRTGIAQPLIRKGQMKNSISYQVGNQLYLTALKYAQHHQYGAPKNNLPARPIFSIRENNKIDILAIIKKNIQENFKK